MSTARLATLVLVLTALAALPARAEEVDDESPYVYQRLPGSAPFRLEAESAVGTRDARPFGARGIEETLRLAVRPLARLEIVVSGTGLFVDGERHDGGALEASFAVLAEPDAPLTLRLGGGVARDLTGTTVARARVTARRGLGELVLAGGLLVELPIAATGRDEADVLVNLAAGLRIAPGLRLGAELAGEDLEGLFEPDAEGGARLIAGPTVWAALAAHLDLKVSAALASVVGEGAGFLARAALGFSF